MGRWVQFFSFIQVIYLLAIMASLLTSTVFIFIDKLSYTEQELYETYQVNQEKLQSEVEYSQAEIYFASYVVKGSVLAVFPAAILIYRSRLLELQTFTTLKKHQGSREGVAYNRCLSLLDYVFCLSRLRQKNYIAYIVFKKRYGARRQKSAEKASVWIILMWFFIMFYYAGLNEFFLTPYYTTQVLMLLFQKITLFIIKMVCFPITFSLYMLFMCLCTNNCRCKGHSDRTMAKFYGQVEIDFHRNLGLDPVIYPHNGLNLLSSNIRQAKKEYQN